jgi:hypothetical protein
LHGRGGKIVQLGKMCRIKGGIFCRRLHILQGNPRAEILKPKGFRIKTSIFADFLVDYGAGFFRKYAA